MLVNVRAPLRTGAPVGSKWNLKPGEFVVQLRRLNSIISVMIPAKRISDRLSGVVTPTGLSSLIIGLMKQQLMIESSLNNACFSPKAEL
jgi:hypothetical protein